MESVKITIVGLGPRGLCVLERILSLAAQRPEQKVHIVVVNKGVPGSGVHGLAVSERFLLNTVAGHLTLVPGEGFPPSLVQGLFENFLTWLNQQGIAAEHGSYVHRHLFGAYCHALYQCLLEHCPLNCRVRYIDDEAIDIQQIDHKAVTRLLTHRSVVSDYVVVAVGHLLPEANRGNTITNIYTAGLGCQDIPAGSTVGIQGFGLTAMDAIAELTRGRGGVFDNGVYKPAGTEPGIVLFSRSGLPSRARPVDDGRSDLPATLHFDEHAALALRKQRRPGTINFMTEIYPLLAQDVARIALEREVSAQEAVALMNRLLWPEIFQSGSQEYAAGFVELVKDDLSEARLGLSGSAVKRALEALISAREAIRAVVNFGGLTPTSHRWFYNHFASAINRNVIGPQYDRMAELLMLIDAKVVSIDLGPAPELQWVAEKRRWNVRSTVFASPVSVDLDFLLHGYSAQPTVENSNSTLLRALVEEGRVDTRPADWLVTPGIAVDAASRCLSKYATVQSRLFCTGVMCEGSTYYNWYVPTKTGKSTPFVEAQNIAWAILGSG